MFSYSFFFSGTIYNLIWTYFARNIPYRGTKLYYKIKKYSMYFIILRNFLIKNMSFLFIYFPEFYIHFSNLSVKLGA